MGGSDSDSSDEWGAAELPDIPVPTKIHNQVAEKEDGDADDGWSHKLEPKAKTPPENPVETGEPMILVDMTLLTQNKSLPIIHSRFDRNSVNDMEAVKRLRKTIEADYDTYARGVEYAGEGIVIPCGTSVWKEALSRLRNERLGHYFCPIFPPKQT